MFALPVHPSEFASSQIPEHLLDILRRKLPTKAALRLCLYSLTVVLAFFSVPQSYGQCWLYSATGSTSNCYLCDNFRGLSMADSLHGFVFHGRTEVYRTNDGGFSWRGFSDFHGLYGYNTWMVDTNIIFVTLEDYIESYAVLRSSDGGYTWQRHGLPGGSRPQGMAFYGRNRGIVVGWYPGTGYNPGTDSGFVFRTTDGGLNWSYKIVGYGSTGNLQFIDSLHAIFTAGAVLHRSTDGGLSWVALPIPNAFTSISFATPKIGIGISPYACYQTTDGGISWTQQSNLSGLGLDIRRVVMRDTNLAVGVGGHLGNSYEQGEIITSSDRGVHWNAQLFPYLLSEVVLPDPRHGFIAGAGSSLLRLSTADCAVPPDQIVVSPPDGSPGLLLYHFTVPPRSVSLQWNCTINARSFSTEIQVSTDSSFVSLLIDSLISVRSSSLRLSGLDLRKTYYWRLAWRFADSSRSSWTRRWSFTTAGGSITGRVFRDLNRNGVFDSGESGISASPMILDGPQSGNVWADSLGWYSIHGLDSGSYTIISLPMNFWKPSRPDTNAQLVHLNWNDSLAGMNFGWYPVTANLIVYPRDGDRNLVLVQPSLPPRSVQLVWTRLDDALITHTHVQVAADSGFSGLIVDSLIANSYSTLVVHPLSRGKTYYWRLALRFTNGSVSEWSPGWRFETAGGRMRGRVFTDWNRNGILDEASESGISSSTISIAGMARGQVATDTLGFYSIEGIDSGSYSVTSLIDYPWRPTQPDTNLRLVHLNEGDTLTGLDFGWFYPRNSMSGTVFQDLNENGLRDSTEPVLLNWKVLVHESSYDDSTVTDNLGFFHFDQVPLGFNRVWARMAPGWDQIYPLFEQPYGYPIFDYGTHATGLDFAVHPIPRRAKIVLTAAEANGVFQEQLWFGVRAGATAGIWKVDPNSSLIDGSEGELELPPKAPGSFDVRFERPSAAAGRGAFGLGSWTDMRDFYSSSQVDTYRVRFLPGSDWGGSYPMTFTWSNRDVASSYSGQVKLLLPAGGGVTPVDMKVDSRVTVVDPSVTEFLIIGAGPNLRATYPAGWNMISLGAEPVTNLVHVLIPVATSAAFSYDLAQGGYLVNNSLRAGVGYWLHFAGAVDSVPVVGGTTLSQETVKVTEGWNLVGMIGAPLALGDIQTHPAGIRSSSFFSYQSGYRIALDSLRPGRAYWAKFRRDGDLILNSSPPPGKRREPENAGTPPLSTLVFADPAGAQIAELYYSMMRPREETEIHKLYEMPPLPPEGAFDVRFGSNRMQEEADSQSTRIIPIRISSAHYPVVVGWKVLERPSCFLIIDSQRRIELNGSGSCALVQEPKRLELEMPPAAKGGGGLDKPREFLLEQNYPNPFNPTTTIRFQISAAGEVKLQLYNVLGREASILMNEAKEPGRYTVNWNATGMASGVYFLRMIVTNGSGAQLFQAVRKLLVLR